ncbi:MAG: signal peptide peptidase SppA [Fluviicola sp.]|nr:signal peptide peptidase SppA [Fluviicola sp.]
MSEKKVSFWRVFWPSLIATLVISFIGWIIAFSVIGGIFSSEPEVKDKTVLHLTLSGEIGESSDASLNGSSFSINKVTGLSDLLLGFERAADDDDVKGIFIDLQSVQCGYATAQELRDAIHRFRKSGKFVVAYLSGEVVTQKQYYISSAANKVYGFPTSTMEFMGLGTEMTYFKRTFDKMGVEMQVIRGSNNDFKSAVEPFFRENMSDSSRLQTERLLGSIWKDLRSQIAKDRKVSSETLNAIADGLKIKRVEDALKYKLIDGVKYRDEVIDMVRKKAGGKADMTNLLAFEKYSKTKFKNDQLINGGKSTSANIAVIVAEGAITVDGDEMTSVKICKYFREARETKSIKTVVFRVNSPGGSALASEEIWREVMLTAKKKKVVVSMGDVAASGGYYIATPASTIFAEPTTITGSIGVFGVIPFTGKLFEDNFGITFDRAQTNSHAMLSTNRRLTEEELKTIQAEIDQIYTQFKKRVADGRGLTQKQVEVLARGRVWTGTDALKHGLVDKIGGLSDAIAYAQKKAGISNPKIKYWPEVKEDPVADLLEQLSEEESVRSSLKQTELPKIMTDSYKMLRQLDQMTGIQMRMPFEMVIH